MPRYHYAQNRFTGGEVGPRSSGATDSEVYRNGFSCARNIISLPQGGAYKRLGSVLVGEAAGEEVCYITFEDEPRDSVLELTQQKMVIWQDHMKATEFATPWPTGDLFEIHPAQDGAEMLFWHRDHPPYRLVKTAVGWSFAQATLIEIPDYHFEDEAGSVAMVQNLSMIDDATWTDADWFRLIVNGYETEKIYWVDNNAVLAQRIYRAIEPYVLERGRGLVQGLTVAEASSGPATFDITFGDGIKGLDYIIQPGDGEAEDAAAAISVVTSTPASGDVFEPAWSATRGWPGAACFYQQRLYVGGTDLLPQTLWGSRLGSSTDFGVGANTGDALSYRIKSEKRISIQWMSSKRGMAIGTTGGDWVIPKEIGVVTPSNIAFARQTVHRSSRRLPVEVDSETFYLHGGNRKVRRFLYEWGSESWQSYDATFFSDHIAGRGFKQLAYTDHPDTIVWGVTENGKFAGMTYERGREVLCWHPHQTVGEVKSIAVAHYDGYDEIWLAVKRANGTYNERIPFTSQDYYEQDDEGDHEIDVPYCPRSKIRDFDAFMDSAVLFEGTGLTEVAVPHLKNQPVEVLADDAYVPDLSANVNGKVALTRPADRVWVGLKYPTRFRPMPVEQTSQAGSSQSMKTRTVNPTLRLVDSHMPLINGQRPPSRSTETLLGTPEGMFTGDIDIEDWGYNRGQVTIEPDLPYPFHAVMLYGWLQLGMD